MKIPAREFSQFKSRPCVMITAYDHPFAHIAEQAQVDIILVGDSGANVVLGLPSTRDIGMHEMELFVAAARRGAPGTHLIADMPWKSCATPATALKNARRMIQLGADSVKLEGHHPAVIRALRQADIEVVGHLGLLPQTAKSLKQVGNEDAEAERIVAQARALEKLGICLLVLEHMNGELAARITGELRIPTVGIGAGTGVNGQVLVLHDVLGIHDRRLPPFAKKHANVYQAALAGLRSYAREVTATRQP